MVVTVTRVEMYANQDVSWWREVNLMVDTALRKAESLSMFTRVFTLQQETKQQGVQGTQKTIL